MRKKGIILSTIAASATLICMLAVTGSAATGTGTGSSLSLEATSDDWKQIDAKGTYLAYSNGSDLITIYKYYKDDDTPYISRSNDIYEAVYQTFYSDGDNIYVVTGSAAKAEDISEVRKMVENVSYPGNPPISSDSQIESGSSTQSQTSSSSAASAKSFTLYINTDGVNFRSAASTGSSSIDTLDRGTKVTSDGTVQGSDGSSWYHIFYEGQEGYVSSAYASQEAPSGSTDSSSTNTAASSDEDDPWEDYDFKTFALIGSEGNIVNVHEQTNGDYLYRDDNGIGYSTSDYDTWKDENGNYYSSLSDDYHSFGLELKQYTLEAENGSTVSIKQTTNGEYYFRDDNGIGYTDNGDGTWSDESGNTYTQID